MDYDPLILNKEDWLEVARVREVREGYGIETEKDERAFGGHVFAVKFKYVSDCPGYAGDMFVLMGGMAECPPMVLIRDRESGQLELVDSSNY